MIVSVTAYIRKNQCTTRGIEHGPSVSSMQQRTQRDEWIRRQRPCLDARTEQYMNVTQRENTFSEVTGMKMKGDTHRLLMQTGHTPATRHCACVVPRVNFGDGASAITTSWGHRCNFVAYPPSGVREPSQRLCSPKPTCLGRSEQNDGQRRLRDDDDIARAAKGCHREPRVGQGICKGLIRQFRDEILISPTRNVHSGWVPGKIAVRRLAGISAASRSRSILREGRDDHSIQR